MLFIKEWITIAENASRILANDPGNSAAEEIRQQAAEQLILAGYPTDTDRNGRTRIETGDYIFMVGVTPVQSSAKMVRTLIEQDERKTRPLDVADTLSTEPAPTAKPPVASSEPATEPLVRPKTKIESGSDGISRIDFEQDTKVTERPKEEYDENATRPLYVAAKAPQATGGKGYVDHMAKTDILFNYHNVRVRSADGIEMNIEIIASPMSVTEGEKQILVWATDGVKTEVSGPGQMATRLVHFGSVDLVVEGHMEGGKFLSSVSPTKRMTEHGVTISSEDEHMGGSGHLRLEDDGVEVRLVPTTTKNKRNGSAEFYYMIRQDGMDDIYGDNVTKDRITFEYKGKTMELLARWSNDVLYSTVREL